MCAADPCSQLSPVNLVMLTNTARAGVLAMGNVSFESPETSMVYGFWQRACRNPERIYKQGFLKFADEIYWSFA